jgi:hypothetical protein
MNLTQCQYIRVIKPGGGGKPVPAMISLMAMPVLPQPQALQRAVSSDLPLVRSSAPYFLKVSMITAVTSLYAWSSSSERQSNGGGLYAARVWRQL